MPRLHRLHIVATCVGMLCILSLFVSGCSHSNNLDVAESVKSFMIAELSNDTSKLAADAKAKIDSISLTSDEDCIHLYKVINKVTYEFHHQGKTPQAFRMHRGILDIMERADNRSHNDVKMMLNMYVKLGASFEEGGMPGISLDYFMQGLELASDTSYAEYQAMLLNNIGVLYAKANLNAKASEYFTKSLEINLAKKVHHEASLNYANLAEVYAVTDDIPQAQKAAQQSLDYLNGQQYPVLLADLRLQQGDLYARQGEYDVAMLRYQSALQQYQESKHMSGIIDTYLHISKASLQHELPDSAMKYAHEAQKTARASGQKDLEVTALTLKSQIFEKNGEYAAAVQLLRESNELADSLRDAESQLRLNNWEVLGTDMFHPATPHPSRSFMWCIIVAALCIALSICLFILYIRKRREIAECRQSKRENTRALYKDIDKRNRELTSMSLEKLKTHEGLTSVCNELRTVLVELNPRESAKRTHLRTLLAQLENLSDGEADEEFKHFFERVHPDFYKALGEKYPELTQRDIRLCAFLYLGLTTKEIASLTYREVRSVESARNRLRKKLGLELTDDLTTHLHSL